MFSRVTEGYLPLVYIGTKGNVEPLCFDSHGPWTAEADSASAVLESCREGADSSQHLLASFLSPLKAVSLRWMLEA